jgi:hypothetical protein
MARNKLSLPVESNSVEFHKDAPVSNFRKRVMESRQKLAEFSGTGRSEMGRPELDILDNPFNGMMQSNRGVL